jgi:hypothetical protein
MLVYVLLAAGFLARVMVHVPNFSPVIAIALFSGVYVDRKYALVLPLAIMAATDLVLGFHSTMPFTWGSMILTAGLGMLLRDRRSSASIFGGSLAGAVLFYLVTNFGMWFTTAMYPKTWGGLMDCYAMGVPFFRTSVVGTLVYATVFFGLYEIAPARWKHVKPALA